MNDQFPIILIFSFLVVGILSSTITKSMNVHEMRSLNSQLDKEFERYLVLDNENIRMKNLIETEKNSINLNNINE
tara:strand:+ start:498 stop:722 length:225 start_codon:yes stop_codon:yes gene_type:complete